MRTTTKVLGTGLAVVAIGALATYAFAQQGPGFGPGRMGMGPGMMKGHGMGPMMGHMQGTFGDPSRSLRLPRPRSASNLSSRRRGIPTQRL